MIAGCSTTPFYGRPSTNQIVNDVTAFNKAYAEASNAQILLNILYARDRLPRQYTGFKDIATTQSKNVSIQPGIASIPLGNPLTGTPAEPNREGKLWGVGSITASGSTTYNPNYGLSPLVGDELNKAAFSPTAEDVFLSLWYGGWPEGVLMALLVNDVQILHSVCVAENTKQFLPSQAKDVYEFRTASRDLNDYYPPFTDSYGNQTCSNGALKGRMIDKGGQITSNKIDNLSYFGLLCPDSFSEEKCRRDHHRAFYDLVVFQDDKGTLKYESLKPSPANERLFVLDIVSRDSKIDSFEWARLAKGLSEAKTAGFAVSFKGLNTDSIADDQLRLKTGDTRTKFLILHHRVEDQVNRYLLTLRSFDQAVYYLGELIRYQENTNTPVFGPPKFVKSADAGAYRAMKNNTAGIPVTYPSDYCYAPLFQVQRKSAVNQLVSNAFSETIFFTDGEDASWAAKVRYGGQWYYAGPASPLRVDCDNNVVADRTATVLSILRQLFELNRNPDSLRLPARLQ